ncbi:MAG: DoxX family membrane protein [Bacteroidetes bacterium]|nr:MAG: DoxX family membrane protein [Bacteroidota bacterium]
MKILLVLNIVLRLFIGGILLYGGYQKFEKPMPSPTAMIDKFRSGEEKEERIEILKIKNFIFGMKQSGFFWEFLGITEILAGLLLLSQVLGFLGAVISLPLTVNIFLFHLFLEPHEVGELIETLAIFLGNIWLIAFEYKKWKELLVNKVW